MRASVGPALATTSRAAHTWLRERDERVQDLRVNDELNTLVTGLYVKIDGQMSPRAPAAI